MFGYFDEFVRVQREFRLMMSIPLQVEWPELYELYSQYGRVIKVAVPRINGNINKGYGFVTFEKEEDMELALVSFNQVSAVACIIPLSILII